MTRLVTGALAVLLVVPADSSAHRLDEYLQATRVAVTPARLALELDLTPGAHVASEIIAMLDRNADGRIAPGEAHAYGSRVLREIVVRLDGRALPLTLDSVRVPSIAEMRAGIAAVRINASASVNSAGGRHDLFYRNDHRPDGSVYLVNAMMPETRAVSIGAQRRDVRQREFHLEYVVSGGVAAVGWSLSAMVGLALLAVARKVTAPIGSAG